MEIEIKNILKQFIIFKMIYSKTALKLNSKGYDYFTQTLNLYNFSSLILNRFEYKLTKLNISKN